MTCATCATVATHGSVFVTALYPTGVLSHCSSCHVTWRRHGQEEQADREARAAAAEMPAATSKQKVAR